MIKLINSQNNQNIKLKIIEITSIFNSRIVKGTRYIIHLEAYINRILYLLHTNNNKDFIIKPII